MTDQDIKTFGHYAPHLSDPDPPQPLMTEAECHTAAERLAQMFPELVHHVHRSDY